MSNKIVLGRLRHRCPASASSWELAGACERETRRSRPLGESNIGAVAVRASNWTELVQLAGASEPPNQCPRRLPRRSSSAPCAVAARIRVGLTARAGSELTKEANAISIKQFNFETRPRHKHVSRAVESSLKAPRPGARALEAGGRASGRSTKTPAFELHCGARAGGERDEHC